MMTAALLFGFVYPNLWGGGPMPNVVAGWAGLVLAALLLHNAFDRPSPAWAFGATSAGVLVSGLFHAGPGAFGRR
jgi:hypothetical protein